MESFNTKRFASNIRVLAEKKGMNIGACEVAMGVSIGYLSRLENSINAPNINTIIAAANLLDVTIDDLLHKDYMPPKMAYMAVYETDYENIVEVAEKWGCSAQDVIHKLFGKRFFREDLPQGG